jgi:hypothetical protein
MTLRSALLDFVCILAFGKCDPVRLKRVTRCVPTARGISLVALLLASPLVAQAQFTYTTNNGAITLTGYTGPGGVVAIPSTTNGLPVTGIGDWAFLSCSNVTSVTIPNSVTNMGTGAFWGCTSLGQATLGNGLTNIDDFAFADCFSLTGVTLPGSLTSIGFGAFEFCTSLTNVTLPSALTNIEANAFYGCGTLTSVFSKGNAPSVPDATVFAEADNATVYYLPGTTNWGSPFGGAPAVLWNPQVQAGAASFGVRTNRFGFNIIGTPDIPIAVEASASLASAKWTTLLTCTLTNGLVYFNDPQWTNFPGRFYRICSP